MTRAPTIAFWFGFELGSLAKTFNQICSATHVINGHNSPVSIVRMLIVTLLYIDLPTLLEKDLTTSVLLQSKLEFLVQGLSNNPTRGKSMSQTRRRFTPQQKAEVVRRHLGDKQPISALADELQIQPSQIHLWIKQVLDQAERALQPAGRQGRDDAQARQIRALEAALARKSDLVAEMFQQLASSLFAKPPAPR
jgi:transposase